MYRINVDKFNKVAGIALPSGMEPTIERDKIQVSQEPNKAVSPNLEGPYIPPPTVNLPSEPIGGRAPAKPTAPVQGPGQGPVDTQPIASRKPTRQRPSRREAYYDALQAGLLGHLIMSGYSPWGGGYPGYQPGSWGGGYPGYQPGLWGGGNMRSLIALLLLNSLTNRRNRARNIPDNIARNMPDNIARNMQDDIARLLPNKMVRGRRFLL